MNEELNPQSQFEKGVVPFHLHNGVDSPLIPMTAGTAIAFSPSSTAIGQGTTISNTGVTSLSAGTGVVLSSGTGVVTVSVSGGFKFGGTGVDGALNIAFGTTTIDLGSAVLVEKNYTAISVTGTGKLAFSNPAPGGTIVILKSQGGVNITSSATPAIDLTLLGGAGGAGGHSTGGGSANGGAAGGSGASMLNSGTDGQKTSLALAGNGSQGTGYGRWITNTVMTGGLGGCADNTYTPTAGQSPIFVGSVNNYQKLWIVPGSGAGGAASNNNGTNDGGAGGRGGGALWIECAGALNFTSTGGGSNGIDASGQAGQAGTTDNNRHGSGGGGGAVIILYNILTANTGAISIAGGGTGGGTYPGLAGADGYSLVALNRNFA